MSKRTSSMTSGLSTGSSYYNNGSSYYNSNNNDAASGYSNASTYSGGSSYRHNNGSSYTDRSSESRVYITPNMSPANAVAAYRLHRSNTQNKQRVEQQMDAWRDAIRSRNLKKRRHMHPDIVGLRAFRGSHDEYRAHVKMLKAKHAKNPILLQHIDQAQRTRIVNHHHPNHDNLIKQFGTHVPTKIKKNGNNGRPQIVSPCARVDDPFTDACWRRIVQPAVVPLLTNPASCDGPPSLGPHQQLVIKAAEMMATSGPLTPMKRRGLLVYHNVGSGKTVTAMGIAIAFWNTGKRIFFVTTNDNMRNNSLAEYAKNCLIYYPDAAVRVVFPGETMPPKPWSVAAYKANAGKNPFAVWCQQVGDPVLRKKFQTMSFWIFGGKSNHVDKLREEKGAVLICDEAQNIFKPATKGAEADACKRLSKLLPTKEYMQHSYSFMLTATPGSTASQVMNLVNLVRPYGMPYLTSQAFVQNPSIARGLVSYADIRGDQSKYGTIIGGKPTNLFIPMDQGYYHAYLNQLHTGNQVKNLDDDPDKSKLFYLRDMQRSCILTLNQVKSSYQPDVLAKKLQVQVGNSTLVFSTKMEQCFKNIQSTRGCQYAYVGTPMTLKACIGALTKMGYEYADPSLFPDKANARPVQPKLRFFAFHKGPITIGGEELNPTDEERERVLKAFKSSANKDGDIIKLFIGTVYEGLDLQYLQALHITSPLPTLEDDEQAVGRALRYCGHKPDANQVKVYRYFATPPKELNHSDLTNAKRKKIEKQMEKLQALDTGGVNMHVYLNASRRGKPLEAYMACVQGQSIECDSSDDPGGILSSVQYKPIQCHVQRCPVQLDAKGELVVPKTKAPLTKQATVKPHSKPVKPQPVKPKPFGHQQADSDTRTRTRITSSSRYRSPFAFVLSDVSTRKSTPPQTYVQPYASRYHFGNPVRQTDRHRTREETKITSSPGYRSPFAFDYANSNRTAQLPVTRNSGQTGRYHSR